MTAAPSNAVQNHKPRNRPPRRVRRRFFTLRGVISIVLVLAVAAAAAAALVPTRRWVYGTGYLMTEVEVKIRPSVAGVVDRRLVSSGELVEEGEPIIQLNDVVQRAAYEQLQSQIKAEHAELERLLSTHELERAQRETRINRAKLNLELSQRNFDRMKKAGGATEIFSLADIEEAAVGVELAMSRLKELRLPHDKVMQKQIEVLRERIGAARKRLPLLETEMKLRQICSPVRGTVYFHRFSVGEFVPAEDDLGQVFDRETWIVKLKMPERAIAYVEESQPVRVALAAYPPVRYGYLEGRVSRVEKLVTPRATGNSIFYIEVQLRPRDDVIFQPGMTTWAYVDAGRTMWMNRLLGW